MSLQVKLTNPCEFQTEFQDESVFTLSMRGNFKLMHKGFEYVKNYTNHGITFWRCGRNRRFQCKGKAQTRQIGQKHMVKTYDTHNHLPS